MNDSLAKDPTRLSICDDHTWMGAREVSKVVERVHGLERFVDIRIEVVPSSGLNPENQVELLTGLAPLITEKHSLRCVVLCAGEAPPDSLRPYASALSLQKNLEYLEIECSGLPCELGSLLSSGQWQRLRFLSLVLSEGDLLDTTLWQLPSLETFKLLSGKFTGDLNLKHFKRLKDVLISANRGVTVYLGGSIKRLALYGDVRAEEYLPQLAFLRVTGHPDPVSLYVRHQKTLKELLICGVLNRSDLKSMVIDGNVLQFLSLCHCSIDALRWTSETPLKALSLVDVVFKDTPVLRASSIFLKSSDADFFRAFSESPAPLIGTTRLGLDCDDPSLPLDAMEGITKSISENLVFFATRSPFSSLSKLPRLKYLGLGNYADVLTAMPSLEKAGKLQDLAVFDPEDSLDEEVRSLLPRVCRTLTVNLWQGPGPRVEGCAVDAKPFFTLQCFWLHKLDLQPQTRVSEDSW